MALLLSVAALASDTIKKHPLLSLLSLWPFLAIFPSCPIVLRWPTKFLVSVSGSFARGLFRTLWG